MGAENEYCRVFLFFLFNFVTFFFFFSPKQKPIDPGTLNKLFTRTGYLFLMEKKTIGTTWNKYYCHYQREEKSFCMIPYNQTTAKIVSNETFKLKACIKRVGGDNIDKRFCFDVIPEDRSENREIFDLDDIHNGLSLMS